MTHIQKQMALFQVRNYHRSLYKKKSSCRNQHRHTQSEIIYRSCTVGPAPQAKSRHRLRSWALPLQLHSENRLSRPSRRHSSGKGLQCVPLQTSPWLPHQPKSWGRCRVSSSLASLLYQVSKPLLLFLQSVHTHILAKLRVHLACVQVVPAGFPWCPLWESQQTCFSLA